MPMIVDVPLIEARGYDLDIALAPAGYNAVSERKGSITYRHPSGSTLVANYNNDVQAFTLATATLPGTDATVQFDSIMPLGVIAATLQTAAWLKACTDAASRAKVAYQQRVAALEAELAELRGKGTP